MALPKVDKEYRKALTEARQMVDSIIKTDANEAETRRRVERFFESLMGYDAFQHITREHAIHGIGDTEHCDFAIQIEQNGTVKPVVMVELKRVGIDIVSKHLKQAASYAINIGCEWILLTNSREWELYHVTFGQPPETKLVDHWNLMTDDPAILTTKFELIGYKNIKKGGLDQLWNKSNVLTPRNLLKVILSEESISLMRRQLKKAANISLAPEEIVGGVRRLLNETALTDLDGIKICLSDKKPVKPVKKEIKATECSCQSPITETPTTE